MSFTRTLPLPIVPSGNLAGITSSNTAATITSTNNTTIQSAALDIYPAILHMNIAETGAGITTNSNHVGGLNISRGSLPAAEIYYSESLGTWEAGTATTLQPIAMWNSTPEFTGIGLKTGEINVGPSLSTHYVLPLAQGASGQSLITDAVGNLSWSSFPTPGIPTEIANSGDQLTNVSTSTGLLNFNVSNSNVAIMTPQITQIKNQLNVAGPFSFTPTQVISNMYFIGNTENLIIYTGFANTTFYLPTANTSTYGRVLIIQNISSTGTVTVSPNGSDTIAGDNLSEQPFEQYDSIYLISNGSNTWIPV